MTKRTSYTYAENNPVTFSDPSGHAAKSGGLSSLQNNIRIANGGNGPALKPVVNNPTAAAKAIYQSRRDAAGLPKENTLLDNVRIYNGQEYYNGLVSRTPVSALMSPVGGSLTFAESIAAKVEAVRCMAYARCENASYNNENITFNWKLYEENKFYRTTADYIRQIENDQLTDEQKRELQEIREAYLRNKDRYERISQESGLIPPEAIAAIHYRENATDFLNGDFKVYLHNGDSLGQESNKVPFPDLFGASQFSEAALDALRGWDGISNYKENRAQQLELTPDSKDLTAMVTFTGFYQGWQDEANNYLYSGTSIYEGVRFDRDHHKTNGEDQNLGTYLVIKTLLEQ